jgi:hypothetical protein
MATRNEFLLDLVPWRSEIFLGIEDLFRCGDVIRCAGQQIDRAGDVLKVKSAAKGDEAAFGKAVLLEQLDDCLKIPTAGQVDRVLVPALEGFLLL